MLTADCVIQVMDEPIDSSKMLEHDVPVDVIVTPTRVRSLLALA